MMHCIAGLHMYKAKRIPGTRFYNMKIIMQMLSLLAFLFCFSCTSQDSSMNTEDNVLTLTAKIPLQNVRGRIDHLAYDADNHLAFVAALGNNTIEVVNISTKNVVHTIKNLREPQGVAYIPSLNRLVVA